MATIRCARGIPGPTSTRARGTIETPTSVPMPSEYAPGFIHRVSGVARCGASTKRVKCGRVVHDALPLRAPSWTLTWSLTATATATMEQLLAPARRYRGTMLSFQKLDVYKCSVEFVAVAIEVCVSMPKGHAALSDQLRRAAF